MFKSPLRCDERWIKVGITCFAEFAQYRVVGGIDYLTAARRTFLNSLAIDVISYFGIGIYLTSGWEAKQDTHHFRRRDGTPINSRKIRKIIGVATRGGCPVLGSLSTSGLFYLGIP